MSLLGEINRKQYLLDRTLSEADSFPYDLTDEKINGLSISNNDTVAITVTITDIEDNVININVAGGKNFEATVKELKLITTSAITSFDIALFEEG